MTNRNATKKALLSSVLALVLCFSMLLGTTYAWFTDSVTSEGNIIKSGTLNIGMYWADGTKAVPALDPTDSAWTNAETGAMFKESQLWEPGYVDVKHIMITNEGTLALKYALSIVANGEVSILSDVIDVYFIDAAVQVADRTALSADHKIGTLTEVLAGLKTGEFGTGVLDAGDEVAVTLALKMQESANNDYQNKSIGTDFSIKLLATQLDAETDSFDDQYDAGLIPGVTMAGTADELHNALANGEDVALLKDIDFTGYNWTEIASYSGTFNGNGHAIKNYTGTTPLFKALDGATVKNLSIENANVTSTSGNYKAILAGEIAKTQNLTTIDNVSVSGSVNAGTSEYYVGGIVGADNSYYSVITNCVNFATVTGGQSVGGIMGYSARDAEIKNCTNYGEISGVYLAGGIVGFVALDESNDTLSARIDGCANYATVTASGTGVPQFVGSNGGIVGNVGRSSSKATTKMMYAYISNSTVLNGQSVYGTAGNYASPSSGPEAKITVVIDGETSSINGVHIVSTAADLLALSGQPLTDNVATQEVVVLFTADIDLNQAEFSSIVLHYGDVMTVFGNGHKISNVKVVSGDKDNTTGQAGMFYAYQGSTLTISDLTLENVTVTADESDSGYAGAVIGYGEGAIVLDNVDVVNATVKGYKSSEILVGQLCAYASLTATNCDVSGTVELLGTTLEPDGHYAGKYIGTVAGPATLTDCTADVTVSGALHANNVGDAYGRISGGTYTEN